MPAAASTTTRNGARRQQRHRDQIQGPADLRPERVADQAAYEAFYMNHLAELPGLARVNPQLTMKMVKAGGALPI